MSKQVGLNNDYNTARPLPEAFLKSIVSCGPGAIAIVDEHTYRIHFANDQFTNVFGYTSEEVGRDNFSLLSLIEDFQLDKLKAQFLLSANSKAARVRYVVYRTRQKDGGYISAYVYAAPLDEVEEGLSHYFNLLLLPDLSSSSLPFISFDTRELFLEQFSKEKFGTFEWVLAIDRVFWSDGVYDIYELDRSNVTLSRDALLDFVHPQDRLRVEEILQQSIATSKNIDIELRIITAQQHIKSIHVIGRAIKDEIGGLLKYVGSLRDITEQRASEQSIQDNMDDLNRSNRELEEFAYVASHDMQEPLRKITTFSDRLADKYKDVLEGDGAMYLERMMASAENMRQLINNLLDFSRISRSTQPFVPINLNFILHQVKTDLELSIEETGTLINAAKLPIIEGSMTQMKQLFTNILNNAIKFRKKGVQPVINIVTSILSAAEAKQYVLPGGQVYHKIQITDNGIGFESEYATRIFQIFQRLHGKTDYPGSGIGLAICKKIVEHHHGIIYAENVVNQGARFIFILPEKQVES